MTSINYTIVAYDEDTTEYVVAYTKGGVQSTVNVPVVLNNDNSVDPSATIEAIESTLLVMFRETPPPPTNTSSLVGTSGVASSEVGVI